MAGKQAKILSDRQLRFVLSEVAETHRYPIRDRVLILLSFKAGLRAMEIANCTWRMVMNSEWQVDDIIALEDKASKKQHGRIIPINKDLKEALKDLRGYYDRRRRVVGFNDPIVMSERAEKINGIWKPMTDNSIAVFFHRLYAKLDLEGCSSHSGRRSFITKTAKKVSEAGASLRDVQQMAGHKNLITTQDFLRKSAYQD